MAPVRLKVEPSKLWPVLVTPFVLMFVLVFVRSFVLEYMWNWFAPHLFKGAFQISYAEALGMALLVGAATYAWYAPSKQTKIRQVTRLTTAESAQRPTPEEESFIDDVSSTMLNWLWVSLSRPAFMLLIGWIVHEFIL